jgi:hypothetical protein
LRSAARLLEDLRTVLSGHFAAEEAESYFGTIVDEAPRLAPSIAQLKNEHAAMLGVIAALCLLAMTLRAKPSRAGRPDN